METVVRLDLDEDYVRELIERLRWLQSDVDDIVILLMKLFPAYLFARDDEAEEDVGAE